MSTETTTGPAVRIEWSEMGQKWCAWIDNAETIGTYTDRAAAETAAASYVAARWPAEPCRGGMGSDVRGWRWTCNTHGTERVGLRDAVVACETWTEHWTSHANHAASCGHTVTDRQDLHWSDELADEVCPDCCQECNP